MIIDLNAVSLATTGCRRARGESPCSMRSTGDAVLYAFDLLELDGANLTAAAMITLAQFPKARPRYCHF
jgi:hypothetical protein